ncbi:protein hinderin isoform X1 [Callorhinchus milii]|nr:protein hinderin isoform X1 [Callorhinchus milii]
MAKAGPPPPSSVSGAFWSADESDEEQPMVFVPGLLCEGNFRHESKVKGRKIQQVKTKLPAAGSVFMSPLTAGDLKPVMSNEIMKEKEVSRSASLKDLCPEDKRRIANLIKELARVSEEKEETVERLKAEQESFEKKIKELEDQNELIMTEREALQQQYTECQELLSVYQKYLSEQQEKLNRSLTEYSSPNRKVPNQRSNPHQPASSHLDGSYLGTVPMCMLINATGDSKHVHTGPSAMPILQYNESLRFPNHHLNRVQHADSLPIQNGYQRKPGSTISAEPVAGRRVHLSEEVSIGAMQLGRRCDPIDPDGGRPFCQTHVVTDGADAESQFTNVNSRHSRAFSEHNGAYGTPQILPMKDQMGIITGEADGRKISTKQRQQLLCQKIELELEKERLRELLAQQEAQLLLKQQQLHQSRLDYGRFMGCLPAFENTIHNEDPTRPGKFSQNAAQHTERYFDLRKDPFHGCLQSEAKYVETPTTEPQERLSAGKNLVELFDPKLDTVRGTASLHTVGDLNRQQTTGTPLTSKKDVATSPVLIFKKVNDATGSTSPIWSETSSYEASLVDLVDSLSPISLQKPKLHTKHLHNKLRKSSAGYSGSQWLRSKPAIASTHFGESCEDLEESRMLEAIFFI